MVVVCLDATWYNATTLFTTDFFFKCSTYTGTRAKNTLYTHLVRQRALWLISWSSIISDSSCENKVFPTCNETWSIGCFRSNSMHIHKCIKCCGNFSETRDSISFSVIFYSVICTQISKHAESIMIKVKYANFSNLDKYHLATWLKPSTRMYNFSLWLNTIWAPFY